MAIEDDIRYAIDWAKEDVEKELWSDISFAFNVRTKYGREEEFNRVEVDVKYWYYSWAILDVKITGYDWGDRPKYAEKKLQNILNKIKKIYAKYSTELIRTAVFSNWEAIYELKK
jgi:hypothetical protein